MDQEKEKETGNMGKVLVIAEIGISHGGEMKRAVAAIRMAKLCGADVAKFQLYDPEVLFPNHEIIVEGVNWWDFVSGTALTLDQVKQLKIVCDREGIEFMASAFDVERVGWLEEVGVKRHKVAYRERWNSPLIKSVIDTEKEVVVSCPDTNYATVGTHPSLYSLMGYILPVYKKDAIKKHRKVRTLYCVPHYPTTFDELLFADHNLFEDVCDCYEYDLPPSFDGFSDHTVGPQASMVAVARGARIIEKHFTVRKGFGGPDDVCALEPDEFAGMVKWIRRFEEVLYAR